VLAVMCRFDAGVMLGAERVRRVEEGDTWWWIMRDPDANVFCVIAAQGRDRSL